MTKDGIRVFLDAVEAAGIKEYSMDTDLGTHFYNNTDNAIIVADDSHEIAWCIRKNDAYGSATMFSGKPILAFGCDYVDIHEVRVAGNADQIKAFEESIGLNSLLTDEQKETFRKIGITKKDIFPITGDYTFKELSEEEYEALDEDAKAKYDEAKRQEELRKDGLLTRAVNIW